MTFSCLRGCCLPIRVFLLSVLFFGWGRIVWAGDVLRSPDGRIELEVAWPSLGSQNQPRWSVRFEGQSVIDQGELGLLLKDQGDILAGKSPVSEVQRSHQERVAIPFGRADHARNDFNEWIVQLKPTSGVSAEVVFRCYLDGVAFRYRVKSRDQDATPLVVLDETTTFTPPPHLSAQIQVLESYQTSHEHRVQSLPAHAMPRGKLLDLPLTLFATNGLSVAITEAALSRYAGMALERLDGESLSPRLISRLTPRPDGSKVVRKEEILSPWRVILIGDRPGVLLESTTLFCLNEPSRIPDTRWIHPGKVTFSWWNGDVYDGKRGSPILSFEMARRYIDFCAAQGIPTHSLTSTEDTVTPWYHQTKPGVEPGPDTDVTRPRPGFELEKIRRYAQSKGVRLWTWVHNRALKGRVEEAFAAFERMGWSGMMVDFFDHDDQDTVEFAEEILQSAARHHLLIHLHGVWKPTGMERTYPNLMNHEGALNLEYLKWSDICTPSHDVDMAFTRLVAGPMDYHLGGFRALPPYQFQPQTVAPSVLGTRCHMLSMYVCFDNPNPMVADYPEAYRNQPGFEFVQKVPTWWDETRVLDARVGLHLATARRKGRSWYVGVLSSGKPHSITLPLGKLAPGTQRVRVWQDDPSAVENPNRLLRQTLYLKPGASLTIPLGTDGGWVGILDEVR